MAGRQALSHARAEHALLDKDFNGAPVTLKPGDDRVPLELSAHAPCTSTMLGLGPLAEPVLVTAPAGVTVRADAAWLTRMKSAAVARATAATIMRSVPCTAWMIFI